MSGRCSLIDKEREQYLLQLTAEADAHHGSSVRKASNDSFQRHIDERVRMFSQGTTGIVIPSPGISGVVTVAVNQAKIVRRLAPVAAARPARKQTRQHPTTQKGRKPKNMTHHGHDAA